MGLNWGPASRPLLLQSVGNTPYIVRSRDVSAALYEHAQTCTNMPYNPNSNDMAYFNTEYRSCFTRQRDLRSPEYAMLCHAPTSHSIHISVPPSILHSPYSTLRTTVLSPPSNTHPIFCDPVLLLLLSYHTSSYSSLVFIDSSHSFIHSEKKESKYDENRASLPLVSAVTELING